MKKMTSPLCRRDKLSQQYQVISIQKFYRSFQLEFSIRNFTIHFLNEKVHKNVAALVNIASYVEYKV